MDTIRIAHISDLHFGADEDHEVWLQLKQYINQTLKPHMILISGDIVDTPDRKLFHMARQELENLTGRDGQRAVYRVCPGNHDRFKKGNGLFDGDKNIMGADAPVFDREFQGLVLTTNAPYIITLKENTNEWRCRFQGCDSSADEKIFFAQGIVSRNTLGSLSNNTGLPKDGIDMDFFVVHHPLCQFLH